MPKPSDEKLHDHAGQLFVLLQELLRAYQFRDVEEICSQGVTLTECHILDILSIREAVGVNGVAASLGLDKSTASRAIRTLEEKKLVRKKANRTDRRALAVELTAAGKRRHAAIVAESVDRYARVLSSVPAAEREQIVERFRALVSLLGRGRGVEPCGSGTQS